MYRSRRVERKAGSYSIKMFVVPTSGRLPDLDMVLVNVASGYVDADVKMYLEWIDDRIRFRIHPNESLAQLDNEELSDFRELNPKSIWTPEISIINRHRDSTFEVSVIPYHCIHVIFVYRYGN